MKTAQEVLNDAFAEVGLIDYMNAIKTVKLRQWSVTAMERTIHLAMRMHVEQFQKEIDALKKRAAIDDADYKELYQKFCNGETK